MKVLLASILKPIFARRTGQPIDPGLLAVVPGAGLQGVGLLTSDARLRTLQSGCEQEERSHRAANPIVSGTGPGCALSWVFRVFQPAAFLRGA